jgi:O-antigen/teichoic acid export membrane protein
MNEKNTLKSKTVSAMILTFSNAIGTQFIQLIYQIVLARLLVPEDFGIIGMVTVFIALSQVFIDSGFSSGLIREKNSTQEDYSTIFFFNLIVAIVLYFALFVSAGIISEFFREPQLIRIIRVLSLVLIINSFGLIQRTMLTKSINFKAQTAADIIAAVLSGATAIIFALLGYGVWSLVIGKLTLQFSQALILSISNRWVPSLVFSFSSFKRLFSFSWKLLLANILSRLYENIYYLVIGKVFSTRELGFFTKAKEFKDVAESSITSSIQKVSYPVLSNIQDDAERLRRGYKKMIESSAYIAFPVMLGLASIAPQMLRILLGDQWVPAIPYFQILCLGGMLYPLQAINLNILQVKGRSDLFLFISILKKFTGLSLIAVVIYFNLGMMGLMRLMVVNSCISFILNSFYSKKLVSYSTFEQIKDIFIYFIMSILMSASILFLSSFVNVNILLLNFLQIAFGVAFYVLLSIILKLKVFYEIKDILISLFLKPLIGTYKR